METPRIVINPRVMVGQPVIEGTRITVEFILEKLRVGMTIDEIIEAYPHLTRAGVQAAIDYASEAIEDIQAYPIMAYGAMS
jgi:uncharacterized protein (DUF433 family)